MASCLNCGAENANRQWADVRICGDCLRLANTVYIRNQRQIQSIFPLLKEKIRATLIQGKLRAQDGGNFSSELCSDIQAQMRALQEGADDSLDQGS